MLTPESLKKKIKTAGDLLAVVKTMKSLAAVNIRQFEAAVESLERFAATVDLGLHAFFRTYGRLQPGKLGPAAVVLVVGSDQGMCGAFNETVAEAALAQARDLAGRGLAVQAWTCGERTRAVAEDAGLAVALHLDMPGGVHGIEPKAAELAGRYQAAVQEQGATTLVLVHNRLTRGGSYDPEARRLLPLDREWQEPFLGPWPRRCLPQPGLPANELFSALFQHFLGISLYRAFGLSLAAENAARLAAMQAAEKNILDLSDDLTRRFREVRQTLITSELLDIVSGFEALAGPAG